MNIDALTSLYCGFWITEPLGNNKFSYERRANKRIYVPPLKHGTLNDLRVGSRIAFSEIESGVEHNRYGLKQMLSLPQAGRDIFIFDNHNHAFAFWIAGVQARRFAAGQMLIHVDQHTDMREPDIYPEATPQQLDLGQAFEYTNFTLNVGNFIKPALKLGIFSEVTMVDSSHGFEQQLRRPYILDLDMDIFSEEMAYISEHYKMERIASYIAGADFITIATSPYFMDQQTAIRKLKRLLAPLLVTDSG